MIPKATIMKISLFFRATKITPKSPNPSKILQTKYPKIWLTFSRSFPIFNIKKVNKNPKTTFSRMNVDDAPKSGPIAGMKSGVQAAARNTLKTVKDVNTKIK